ncbi:MAG TPA: CheR family methyltransferase, partial [Tepidisphaeraceae bacterium]|nr:CheR family methyltransferase [Tepidisphaeraceae bacterium]
DGAAGLQEIKAAGGFTMVQEPKTAKYDGMPRAAISSGEVDLVLSPPDMAPERVRIADHPLVQEAVEPRDHPVEKTRPPEDPLARIFLMLRNSTGVDFSHYKLPTIHRRLHRRMVLHKVDTIDKYVKYLQTNPGEVQALYQDILIRVTRFFRDPDSYKTLIQKVFPGILDNRRGDTPVRIWVPGCSTGEEAYSVAIALMEYLGDRAAATPVQIFATDVSESAVEQARLGIYPENIIADVSADRLRRFFQKINGSYRISKPVRDLCVFARQDLTRDPPFSRLDLILCRNVLIYLGPVLQKKLMNVFHYALKLHGFLMLGSAETIGTHTDFFAVEDKRHKLYTKKPVSARTDVAFPVEYSAERPEIRSKIAAENRGTANIQQEANRLLLARYSPPGVLVDSDLKIMQFRGQTGAFLEPAPGDASMDLLKMAREGLLYGLRTALLEARKSARPIRKQNLLVKQNGHTRPVNLEVIPISTGEGKYFLVLFEKADSSQHAAPSHGASKKSRKGKPRQAEADLNSELRERVRHLDQELAASREYMQSMIQDLEAANEELQSANEEILSSNEELQSTNEELDTAKEELQSTNEELNTVNEELQGRNEELSRVNSDLVNLLGSVQIAIVMVASDLRIRRFTPMAEKVLNLIPTDIGRPISDIKPNIDLPDLEQIISDAIDSVTIKERHCTDRYGNRYLLRVRPYKNVENRIDGAVLALFEVVAAERSNENAEPQVRKKDGPENKLN